MNYKVEWKGPFSITDSTKPLVIGRDDPSSSGLYLFAVYKDNAYYPTYIGKATKISKRMKEHIEGMLGGTTWVYDIAETLSQGKLVYTQYRPNPSGVTRDFIDNYSERSKQVYQCLQSLHIFLALLDVTDEELQRVESAVINAAKKCELTSEMIENQRMSRQPDPVNVVAVEASAPLGIELKGVVGSFSY